MTKLLIGITTAPTEQVGKDLAKGLIQAKLAVCVHLEGPIQAFFSWNEEIEEAEEFRMLIKFFPKNKKKIKDWILQHHPYEIPQWIVLQSKHVSRDYLQWAKNL